MGSELSASSSSTARSLPASSSTQRTLVLDQSRGSGRKWPLGRGQSSLNNDRLHLSPPSPHPHSHPHHSARLSTRCRSAGPKEGHRLAGAAQFFIHSDSTLISAHQAPREPAPPSRLLEGHLTRAGPKINVVPHGGLCFGGLAGKQFATSGEFGPQKYLQIFAIRLRPNKTIRLLVALFQVPPSGSGQDGRRAAGPSLIGSRRARGRERLSASCCLLQPPDMMAQRLAARQPSAKTIKWPA